MSDPTSEVIEKETSESGADINTSEEDNGASDSGDGAKPKKKRQGRKGKKKENGNSTDEEEEKAVDPDNVRLLVPIPTVRVGEFIGRDGKRVQERKEQSGALITVAKYPNRGNRSMRNVIVRGTEEAVQKAKTLIQEFCASTPQEPEELPPKEVETSEEEGGGAAEKRERKPKNRQRNRRKGKQNERGVKLATGLPQETDLLPFLQNHEDCLKCSVKEFHDWLHAEDILTLSDLVDAFSEEDFVKGEMQNNGLKGFKRAALQKSAKSALDMANAGLKTSADLTDKDPVVALGQDEKNLDPVGTKPRASNRKGKNGKATNRKPRRPRATAQINETKNQEWIDKFNASGLQLIDLTRGDKSALPKASTDSESLCLAYQLKGRCFPGCPREESHRALTDEEKSSFQTFMDDKVKEGAKVATTANEDEEKEEESHEEKILF